MSFIFDGQFTTITLTGAGTTFLEKEVTPPSFSGGGPNDITNMRSTRMRWKQPKKLITGDKMTTTVFFDPILLTNMMTTTLQLNQLIVVAFPNTHTWSFWGWCDEVKPSVHKDGEAPTIELTIELSNTNNTNPPVEQIPYYA